LALKSVHGANSNEDCASITKEGFVEGWWIGDM